VAGAQLQRGGGMMMMSFVGPVIAAILYVIVFQKAGFGGAILAVGAAPLLGPVLFHAGLRLVDYGLGPVLMLLQLGMMLLNLLPLLVLAFKSWPPVAAPNSHSEK